MLLQVVRPVCKSASRALLAGSNAASELADHGVTPTEVAPPTNHYVNLNTNLPAIGETPPSPVKGPVVMAAVPSVPPLWHASSSRWPVAVESWLSQGSRADEAQSSSSSSVNTQNVEVQSPQGTQNVQLQQVQFPYQSMTDGVTVWHSVGFPAGALVWPAVFFTNEGFYSAGQMASSFPPEEVSEDQLRQLQGTQQVSQQEVAQSEPLDGKSPAVGARTGCSRKQRRRQQGQLQLTTAAPDSKNLLPAEPGLQMPREAATGWQHSQQLQPGLVHMNDSVFLAAEADDLAEPNSPQQQLWPPTPESTPPCSPRGQVDFSFFPSSLLASQWPAEMTGNCSVTAATTTPSLDLESTTIEQDDEDVAACEQMLVRLEGDDRQTLLSELLTPTDASPSVWQLACSAGGTRVVQKAFEVANTSERIALALQLKGHVREAITSPHANHALQKCIEVIQPERLDFVLSEIMGLAVTAARHRYGCRVLERLLEHCPSEQTASLVDEVLVGAAQLCRHTFGNFVVQHILEHGTLEQRHVIANVIQEDVQRLARHRVASHVVRCAIKHSAPEDRQRLIQALRADASELADLAHHHCGSFVVREMRRAEGLRR